MSKLKSIFLTLTLLIPILAHGQVDVQLRQPPPYQLKLEDFWKVTLFNTTPTTYNVYLYGIATNAAVGKIVDAKTKTFTLSPGMKVVSGKDISPIEVLEKNTQYADAMKFTGALPTGDYEICVTVYNADNGEELGSECITHTVEIIQGIELLLPENKTKIIAGSETADSTSDNVSLKGEKANESDDNIPESNVDGSFITFSWLAASPAPRNGKITYTLIITEILLNQTAYSSIQSNPAFYKIDKLPSTVHLFPFVSRGFVNDRKYAWQVTAYYNGTMMTQSEVNEFSYTNNNVPGLKKKPPPRSGNK